MLNQNSKPLSGSILPFGKLPDKFDQINLSRSNRLQTPQPKMQPPPKTASLGKLPQKSLEQKPKADSGFKLVDVSKGKFRNSEIYKGNFRFKTAQALKGTLKDANLRYKVANMLWNARGGGGIAKWEVKDGLKKMGLADHQIRAVRRKLGAY